MTSAAKPLHDIRPPSRACLGPSTVSGDFRSPSGGSVTMGRYRFAGLAYTATLYVIFMSDSFKQTVSRDCFMPSVAPLGLNLSRCQMKE